MKDAQNRNTNTIEQDCMVETVMHSQSVTQSNSQHDKIADLPSQKKSEQFILQLQNGSQVLWVRACLDKLYNVKFFTNSFSYKLTSTSTLQFCQKLSHLTSP